MTPTPTLLYLHGFNSAPTSAKGWLLAQAAAALPSPPHFFLPQLPHRPAQAMDEIEALLDAHAIDAGTLTFIGSSLGGFYATWLAERHHARAVVINPAVQPYASLQTFLGPQRNPYTGETYVLTDAHLAEMSALRVARITHPERYFLLARTGDELLDWRQAVAYYGGAWQYVAGGGDHGWTDFADEVGSVLRFACCAAWHWPARQWTDGT